MWDRREQLRVFQVRVQGRGGLSITNSQRKKGLTRSRSSTAKTNCAKWADDKVSAQTFREKNKSSSIEVNGRVVENSFFMLERAPVIRKQSWKSTKTKSQTLSCTIYPVDVLDFTHYFLCRSRRRGVWACCWAVHVFKKVLTYPLGLV